MVRRKAGVRRGVSFCILFFGLLPALLSTIVFLIDVILVAVVRSHIKSETDGIVTLAWGNAVCFLYRSRRVSRSQAKRIIGICRSG